MQIFHTALDSPKFSKDLLFLDIETTGLSKTKHSIYCIGMLSYQESQAQITQILCFSPDDEKQLLQEFLTYIMPYNTLFTYGGSHFDLSFIKERLDFHGLDSTCFFEKKLIDFKKIPFILGLLNNTLGSRSGMESALGYTRSLTSSGKDLVKAYSLWQATGQTPYRDILTLHNQEELQSLLYFYDLYKIGEYLLPEKQHTYVNLGTTIYLQFTNASPFITHFKFAKDDFILSWEKHSLVVKLEIHCPIRNLKRYLTPATDYFFIPEQNQVLHKSIAQFIPSTLRKKVTKKDCYICKHDHFIRTYVTKCFDEPLWYDDFGNTYLPFSLETHFESPSVQKAALSIVTYCIRGFKS